MAKKVLITGANKGIGKQIAREMGKHGWIVLIGARNESRGLETMAELNGEGIETIYINIDLQNQETILAAVNTIKSQHSDLDMLINNAAIPGDIENPATNLHWTN